MSSNSISPSSEDRSQLRRLLLVLGGLATLLLIVYWPGCRQYPAVTSKESLQLMKLLYAACNTKETTRLSQVEQGFQKLIQTGKLSLSEQEVFAKIIGMAKSGQWNEAEQAAFQFAQDQVGQGYPAPQDDEHDPLPKAKSTKGNLKK